MSVACTVVDYGLGNLLSVSRALEHLGVQVTLSDSAAGVDRARLLVVPGVGAFSDGMRGLGERGLVEPLRRYAASGRPMLGICLGMQLLFDVSEEFGEHSGLGLVPGRVVAIPRTGADGRPHKIPHIGWNQLQLPAERLDWQGTILAGIAPGSAAYFVHSFSAVPARAEDRLADCDYDGRLLCAAVVNGNVYGCQFHPEKSAELGLEILHRFIALDV